MDTNYRSFPSNYKFNTGLWHRCLVWCQVFSAAQLFIIVEYGADVWCSTACTGV
jgi:hypothetical protein